MPILREKQVWRKRRPNPGRSKVARIDRLSPEQEANVKAALVALHDAYGSWPDVAKAIGISVKSIERAISRARRPTVGWALIIAEFAHVPIDDVLTGMYPRAERCPVCGRW